MMDTSGKVFDDPFTYTPTGEEFDAWLEKEGLALSDSQDIDIVWVDLETTGLNPTQDIPLEGAIILTDKWGNVIENGVMQRLIFDPTDWYFGSRINMLEPIVKEMHEKSGLLNDLARVLSEDIRELRPCDFQRAALNFLGYHFEGAEDQAKGQYPIAGATTHFDRGFLLNYTRELHDWFHYRNQDVSGLRQFAKLINPPAAERAETKRDLHRALPDLADSISMYQALVGDFLVVA